MGKFQVTAQLIKRTSSRTIPQNGVAIPIRFAVRCLKSKGIATPVCALARNDVVF